MSMGNTYMSGEYRYPLEAKEWTQVWHDEAMDKTTPRVLLVGDSIFNGIISNMIHMVNGTVLFDSFCSSKAVDNPFLLKELDVFMEQQGQRKVILFNNGLHGWHLDDETQYAEGYENIIQYLQKKYPKSQLVVSLTTVVKDEHLSRVLVRNQVAERISKKYQCPIMDMFTESQKQEHRMTGDGVHFEAEGYQELCKSILDFVKAYL